MNKIHRSEDAWYVQDGTWTKIDNPIAQCGEVDFSLFSSGYSDKPGLKFGNEIWEATVHYATNPKLLKPYQSRAPTHALLYLPTTFRTLIAASSSAQTSLPSYKSWL